MATDAPDLNPISVHRQDVKITKMLDTGQFETDLAIRLTIESTHPEPIDVQIIDQLPNDFNMQFVGFHPDYGEASWRKDDDGFAIFEDTLHPDEPINTLYVVTQHDSYDLSDFKSEPQVVEATPIEQESSADTEENDADTSPSEPNEEAESSDDSDNPEDTSWFDGEKPPEDNADSPNNEDNSEGSGDDDDLSPTSPLETHTESDEASTDNDEDTSTEPTESDPPANTETNTQPEDSEPAEDDDIDETTPVTGDPRDTTESPLDAPGETTPDDSPASGEHDDIDEGSVVSTLVAEIQSGTVTDDELEVLADAIGRELSVEGAPDTRLTHLESRVSELEAYSTALETFIEDTGTAEELADELQEVRATVESLEEQLDETSTDTGHGHEEFQSELDELEEQIEDLQAWRDAMTSAVGDQ